MKTRGLQLVIVFLASIVVNAWAETHYVDVRSTNPISPYTSWATAATNIQDAVQLASAGDLVLVTNGIYKTGSSFVLGLNRVAIGSGIKVQSVHGPEVTTIMGYQVPGTTNGNEAVRCAFLHSNASLSGFTLTSGATRSDDSFGVGGGVLAYPSSTIYNCVVVGNAAYRFGGGGQYGTFYNCIISGNSAAIGGGIENGILHNCLVVSNSATVSGGGVDGGSATNCTIVANYAVTSGGGAFGSQLANCILFGNRISVGSSPGTNALNVTATYCCATPLLSGPGNITNAPTFEDMASGNYRLRTGSICIDAGSNDSVTTNGDLDNNPRLKGSAVDIGAYENQITSTVHYVSLKSTNPVAPYTSWSTAATNIQDAVSAAQPGEIVVADSGNYTEGGTVIYGSQTNRVALTNAITLISLNGPGSTAIVGGTQTRCVYVGSNSILSGFTITNGQTRLPVGDAIQEQSGAGIWCETGGSVANCLIINNSTTSYLSLPIERLGGGVYGGAISNCIFTGNSSGSGGAVAAATLWNCTLTNNTANQGGGAHASVLYNCVLSSNATVYYNGFTGHGGGAHQCFLYNTTLLGNKAGDGSGTYRGANFKCVITGNSASGNGGGTYQSTNHDCFISDNTAGYGGGAYGGVLYNCVVSGNIASTYSTYGAGGGVHSATLYNCTVTSNSGGTGGGMYGGTAHNSIIYYNSAPIGPNWTGNPLMLYSCTAPHMNNPGNTTNEPAFVDTAGGDFRLKWGSPCIDGGYTDNYMIRATTNDIRGIARPLDGNGDGVAKFDIGAYEYDPEIDQIPAIRAASGLNDFATGFAVPFSAQIAGKPDYFWWDFNDGVTVTNQNDVSHAWTSPGTYNITLTAYYSSLGHALSATTQVRVVQQPVYYVALNSNYPTPPYTNWMTASHTIQEAVAAGTTPGRLVLVADGAYRPYYPGIIIYGSMYNALVLTNSVIVQSVNGPVSTTIQPHYGRCAYVGSNAVLSGFTLTGGRTLSSGDNYKEQSGGGVWCETGGSVSNCIIANNWASLNGGGAYQGMFYGCTFTNNLANNGGSVANGGAVYQCVLQDCLLVSNKVSTFYTGAKAGGAYGGTLYNCIIRGNSAENGDGGGTHSSTLHNCTVTGNRASNGGGGVSNTFWNCLLTENYATKDGGGALGGILHNCLVINNQAASAGGGAADATLYNCTVANNSAAHAGGVYGYTKNGIMVYNSIIYGNISQGDGNRNWNGIARGFNSCSIPLMMPPRVFSPNITNDPAFINPDAGDFRLQSNSPCINAGNNAYVTNPTDLDGNPRTVGGTTDIGAYEFQNPGSTLSYAWAQKYGLPTDGSADALDSDEDGMNNWQEWKTATIPTNALSALTMSTPSLSISGVTLSWQSIPGATYYLERSTDLCRQPAFSCIQSNIIGSNDTTSYKDTTGNSGGPFFYRVGIQDLTTPQQ